MEEIDITTLPEYFLVKMSIKNDRHSNIKIGSRRRFRLGCDVVEGQPVKRARVSKSTLGCHATKIKYDPMTTNVVRFEKVDGGTLIETLTSTYMMFPV